jgi:hypothetical protein
MRPLSLHVIGRRRGALHRSVEGSDDTIDRALHIVVYHQQEQHGPRQQQEDKRPHRSEDVLQPPCNAYADGSRPGRERGRQCMFKPTEEGGQQDGCEQRKQRGIEEGAQGLMPKDGVSPNHYQPA